MSKESVFVEKRMEVRPRHLENMKNMGRRIICAGGLPDDEGKPRGSVIVMELDSPEDLEKYLATEPYITEGVWEKVETMRMNVVLVNGEKVGK